MQQIMRHFSKTWQINYYSLQLSRRQTVHILLGLDWSEWNAAVLSGGCRHQIPCKTECLAQTMRCLSDTLHITTDDDTFQPDSKRALCLSVPALSHRWTLMLRSRAEFQFVRGRLNFAPPSFSYSSPVGFGRCPGSPSDFVQACLGPVHTAWAQRDLAWQNQMCLKKAGSHWSRVAKRVKVSSPELIQTAG